MASGLDRVDLITDFQLQVEHALDLRGREAVVFVDAAASGPEPFAISPIVAEPDASYTTHAMSPGAILRVFEEVHSSRPPPAWLMAIRGYTFSLGSPLTPTAERNLEAAEQYLLEHFLTR
jgi:hydrogenase maturation protease